jgi:hypothetical protein
VEVHVEQSSRVLGPFDIATDPEQCLRDPVSIRSRASLLRLLLVRAGVGDRAPDGLGRERRWAVGGQDPAMASR